jgi:hypothetical protein
MHTYIHTYIHRCARLASKHTKVIRQFHEEVLREMKHSSVTVVKNAIFKAVVNTDVDALFEEYSELISFMKKEGMDVMVVSVCMCVCMYMHVSIVADATPYIHSRQTFKTNIHKHTHTPVFSNTERTQTQTKATSTRSNRNQGQDGDPHTKHWIIVGCAQYHGEAEGP